MRGIFQQGHRELEVGGLPSLLRPAKGKFALTDYEKAFAPDLKGGEDIFDMRGSDRSQGCLVVVRPDQYVAHVLPLDGFGELSAYFDGFLLAAG